MKLISEEQLNTTVKEGMYKLLKPALNNSRIVLSKLKSANGELNHCNGFGLFIPLSGNKTYHIQDEKFTINPGQYLILNHTQSCILKLNNPDEAVALNIRLNKDYIEQALYSKEKSSDTLLSDPFPFKEMETSFNQGVYYLNENLLGQFISTALLNLDIKNENFDVNESAFFNELADHIISSQRSIHRQMNYIPAIKRITKQEIYKRIHQAKSIIHDQLLNELQIPLLAREVAMSEAHFLRCFKLVVGQSPLQYYLIKKHELAVEKIRYSNMSIFEIALQLGYSDLSSFSRNFKKYQGVSPIEYRKKKVYAK